MKQFSLEEYLRDPQKKIITRDGKSARIICTNRKSENCPIIALIQDSTDNYEDAYYYTTDGKWVIAENNSMDLFFASKKKEGWINVSRIASGTAAEITYSGVVYPAKEEAIDGYSGVGLLDTIKIEWEEEQ